MAFFLSIVFNLNLYTQKEEMKQLITQWQNKGETVVFTNGCFDILHRGHITYLQEAAQLGDHLIIGLNSDASVRRLKGKRVPSYVKRIEQHY